jgi:hypothetical protein
VKLYEDWKEELSRKVKLSKRYATDCRTNMRSESIIHGPSGKKRETSISTCTFF